MRTRSVLAASYLVIGIAGLSAQTPVTRQARTPATSAAPRSSTSGNLLPGTRSTVLSTIQGNALDSTNVALPNTLVRLRDARIGHIVDLQTTDRTGVFMFRSVDPGTYIVEAVSNDSTVLATSQLISVKASEVISTFVKLPFRAAGLTGLLGQTAATAAGQSVIAAAASTGILTAGPRASCVTGPCQ